MRAWNRSRIRLGALGALALALPLFAAPAGAVTNHIYKFGPNFNTPIMAVEAGQALYVSEAGNYQIKKIDYTRRNRVTVFAGTGVQCTDPTQACGDGGPATSARFSFPNSIGAAPDGLLISEFGAGKIRKVAFATGIITTIAGTGTPGFSGDGGPATNAQLGFLIGGITVRNGNIFIADTANNRIRCIGCTGPGIISTFVGTGKAAGTGPGQVTTASPDGTARRSANLLGPMGITFDPTGALVFSNNCDVVTVYGPLLFGAPGDPASYCDSTVRRVIPSGPNAGRLQTIAGTSGVVGSSGMGGNAADATLRNPTSVAYRADGRLLIGELGNSMLEFLSSIVIGQTPNLRPGIRCVGCIGAGRISLFAGGRAITQPLGNGGPAVNATIFIANFGSTVGTNLFLADQFNGQVRRIEGPWNP